MCEKWRSSSTFRPHCRWFPLMAQVFRELPDANSCSPPDLDQTLLVDLLALHMVRSTNESTLIVTLPQSKYWLTTSAVEMQDRVLLAGKGVYWSTILQQTKDPTFMLVIMLWHALYPWDEAMAVLYEHISYLVRLSIMKRQG